MKKIILICLTVAVVATLAAVPAFADGLTVEVSSAEASPGDTVTLEVSISGNPGIAAYSVDLLYSQNALELTALSNGRKLRGLNFLSYVPTKRVAAFGAYNATQDGLMFKATFRVLDTAPEGLAPVSVSVSEMVSEDYIDYSPEVISGGVTVVPGEPEGDGGSEPDATPAPDQEDEPPQATPVIETAEPQTNPGGNAPGGDQSTGGQPAANGTAGSNAPGITGQQPAGGNAVPGDGTETPGQESGKAENGGTSSGANAARPGSSPVGDEPPAAVGTEDEAAPAAEATDGGAKTSKASAEGDSPVKEPAAADADAEASGEEPPEKGNTGAIIGIAAAAVAVCAVAVVAVLAVKRKKSAKAEAGKDA